MTRRDMHRGADTGRGFWPRPVLLCLVLIGLLLGASALAGDSWELRVCADPVRMPFTSDAGLGFENLIAQLIASELGAELVYEWVAYTSMQVVRNNYLWAGKCDMVFGLDDSEEGYLHSLAYYRSPYVFVQRADADRPAGTFDELDGLSIALQEVSTPPHVALVNRGLVGQIRVSDAYGHYGNADELSRIVDIVSDGTVDVGIAWGPIGGYFAAGHNLTVTPVSPEIEPPFLLMLKSVTIGFRPGDEALRDRVDTALASRWDEIQLLLAEYHVPLSFLPDPRAATQPVPQGQLRIGVVLPESPGSAHRAETDDAANSARSAAELAASEAAKRARDSDLDVLVLYANAPDAATASRAAKRLTTVDGVHALVGGLGAGQPEALASAAAQAGIPFLNLGDNDMCCSHVFQMNPRPDSYLSAYASLYPDVASWSVIFEDSARGHWLAGLASEVFTADLLAVAPDALVYTNAIRAISSSSSDGVLVLLAGEAQLEFLSQLSAFGMHIPVIGLPDQVTQTRAAYDYLRETVPDLASLPRLAAWDAALPVQLNDTYAGRFGAPLEPAGWTTHAAVTILAEAHLAAGTSGMLDYLDRGLSFDAGKEAVAFDPCTGELLQELYVVRLAEHVPVRGAAERLPVSKRIGSAEVLDAVGPAVPAERTSCR